MTILSFHFNEKKIKGMFGRLVYRGAEEEEEEEVVVGLVAIVIDGGGRGTGGGGGDGETWESHLFLSLKRTRLSFLKKIKNQ